MSEAGQPRPPWSPSKLQRMTLTAAVACAVGLLVVAGFAVLGNPAAGWVTTMGLVLLLAGLYNLRVYRQLRSGTHWSQRVNGAEDDR